MSRGDAKWQVKLPGDEIPMYFKTLVQGQRWRDRECKKRKLDPRWHPLHGVQSYDPVWRVVRGRLVRT